MTGRPDTFMPFYIADYLGDTGHLSTIEHGAYCLLLFHYWRTGRPLRDDPDHLRKIARMSVTEWVTVSVTVRGLFRTANFDGEPVLVQKRIEEELLKATSRYARAKAASVAANKAKSHSEVRVAANAAHKIVPPPTVSVTEPHTDPVTVSVTKPQPQPHLVKGKKDSCTEAQEGSAPEFQIPEFLRRKPEAKTEALAPPAVPPDPPKAMAVVSPTWIEMPTVSFDTKGETVPITEAKLSEWQETYLGVNVPVALKAIRQWLVDNRTRRKTKTGMMKFINAWLAREQDKASKGVSGGKQSFGAEKNNRFLSGLARTADRDDN